MLERLLAGDGGPGTRYVGVGMLLAAAHTRSRAALNEALRPLGLNARGLTVMLALPMYGPVSQRDLIERIGIDKSTMVRIIDELQDGGLVSRERSPHDRRAYTIVLTRRGEQVVEEARRIAVRVGEELFGSFTEAERDRLVDLLRRLAEPAAGSPR